MVNIHTSQSRVTLALQESLNDQDDEYEGDIRILPRTDPDFAPSREYISRSLSNCCPHAVKNGELRYIPYSNIHCTFDTKNNREYFMPGQKIDISINRERQGNVIIYVICIKHGDFHWSVRRRLANFQSLHNNLRASLLLNAAGKITKHKNHGGKDFNILQSIFSKMPTRPDSWLNPADLDHRKEKLESYLSFVLKIPELRNHIDMYRFLEVSRLSFVNQLGAKWREGFVVKLSGGRYNETKLFHNNRKRWLVIKDTYLAYMRPKDDNIRDVILMDQNFSVEISSSNACHLMIKSQNRILTIKTGNSQVSNSWYQDITSVSQSESTAAVDFITLNRYESFAPIREDCYSNWFQDGRSYMDSVADAMENAKEEIFITDWWFSPEILLKRPNISGKWRLDHLLKRKAEQGVSIFLLLYKEISYVLQLNSLRTKKMLTDMHPNIKVMRHPDKIMKWTHHEKCVIIDQKIAYFGGIDLCFGRWDTKSHLLTDLGDISCVQDIISMKSSSDSPISSHEENSQVIDYERNLIDMENLEIESENENDSILEDQMKTPNVNPIVANCLKSLLNEVREKQLSSSESLEKRGILDKHAVPDIIVEMEQKDIKFRKRYKTEPAVTLRNKVKNLKAESPSRRLSGFSCYFNRDGEPLPLTEYIENSSMQVGGMENGRKMEVTLNSTYENSKEVTINSMDGNRHTRHESVLVRSRGQSGHWPISGRANISLDIKAAVAKLRNKSVVSVNDSNDYLTKQQKDIYLKATLKTNNLNNTILPHRSRMGNFLSAVRGDSTNIINSKHRTYNNEIDDNSDELESSHRWWLGKDYTNFIIKEFDTGDFVNPFSDGINRFEKPRMPWHDIGGVVYGKPARDMARHFIQRWNFTKNQKRKTNETYPHLMPKSYRKIIIPDSIKKSSYKTKCQVLRSSSQWSCGLIKTEDSIYQAYIEMIFSAKYYIYIENQFFISSIKSIENQVIEAIFQRIVRAHKNNEVFRVYVIMPLLPAFEDELGDSISGALKVILHWNYQTISRGGNSLLERLISSGVTSPFEYITFYGLRGHGELPQSTNISNANAQQEKLTTELVYVHSKLMIVDDNSVLIGSANINDRSLIGKRDSEIAVIIEDETFVTSRMNGNEYQAGNYALSLRKSLFREHLGITKNEIDVSDPISESFYKKKWLRQASINTGIYDKVFNCIPNNHICTFDELSKTNRDPESAFHFTNPLESRELLNHKVKGHLVLLPLEFLKGEQLQPHILSKEGMMPDIWV